MRNTYLRVTFRVPAVHTDPDGPHAGSSVALALATLIRHTAGAISAYVVVILILQLIVGALPVSLQNAIHRFLPSTVGNSLISSNAGPYTFSPWVGLIVLCGYTLGLLLIGTAVLRRRDA